MNKPTACNRLHCDISMQRELTPMEKWANCTIQRLIFCLPLSRQLSEYGKRWKIFGTDYATEDGTAVRDYIHVSDLAQAHVLALQYLLSGGKSLAANLGTGHGASVRQIIAAVERAAGRAIKVVSAPRRAGDPPALVADPTRAYQALKWRPQFSSLERIVTTAWDCTLAPLKVCSANRLHSFESPF